MGLAEFEEATRAMDAWESMLDSDVVDRGMSTQREWEWEVLECLARVQETLMALVFGDRDPRCDPSLLIARAHLLAARADHVSLPGLREQPSVMMANWVGASGAARPIDDDVDQLIMHWSGADDAPSSVNAWAAERAAEQVTELIGRGAMPGSLARLVRSGASGLGPKFLALVVLECLTCTYRGLAVATAGEVALDELAAMAASTRPVDVQSDVNRFPSRSAAARAELIGLAEHPELTAAALARVPHHRVEQGDMVRLQKLVADRAEVIDERPGDDMEVARSVAGELALMRALDAAGTDPVWDS